MAGIGFQLRKILAKDRYATTLRAYLYAGMISSGPWVLSIISVMVIGLLSLGYSVPSQEVGQFLISVTYLMASSLIFTGGLQLFFIRYISDRLYEKKYESILPKRNYAELSYDEFRRIVSDIGDKYIKESKDFDSYCDLSLELSMEIAFQNQDYISVKTNIWQDIGGGTGSSHITNTFFRNVNYKDGYIVGIHDVLTSSISSRKIGEFINKYSSVSTDKLSVSIDELSLPEEFFFDDNSITFIYPKYSIACGAEGEITLKIPYKEIRDNLKSDFYRKITNS